MHVSTRSRRLLSVWGPELLEDRLALNGTTLLYDDFQGDAVGTLPASADNFWNATGPNSFIQVAGPAGTYSDRFGIAGNKSLVMDTPGASQAIVSWHEVFSDDPTQFQTGTISFDVYLGEPIPARTWTYLDFRLGYGDATRTAPTTVDDTTVWNSFRVNLGSPDVVVDNGNVGQSAIASNTVLHVVYELNGTTKTYRLKINGNAIDFGTGNPDRPWIAGAPGVNMLGFFGAYPATSSAAYIDNLQVVKADAPAPWTPPDEPTDIGEWYQHRGNKRLTGEAQVDQNIVAGASVIWSQYVGSRESWVGLTPGGGSSNVNLPGGNVLMSQAEQVSWNLNGPWFDLAGTGTLTSQSTSSIVRIGDFIPGNGVLEKLEGTVLDTTFGQGYIRLYKWMGGAWVQQWQSPTIPAMQGIPNIITGDFDNDGQLEVAITPWTDVYVLSMATGQIEKTGTFKPAVNESGRGYGWFGAYDLTGDGREEFIVMGDFQDFVSVLGWNASGNLVKLWDYSFSPNLAGKQTSHRPGAFPLADVTGDGNLDIVTSIYNDNGDHRWHVIVFNALTGAVLYDLVDHAVDGLRDVNGDGDSELFVRQTQGALLPPTGTVEILDIQGGSFTTLWSQNDVGFVSQNISDFPLNVNSATSTGKLDLLTGPIAPGGNSVFFTKRIIDASTNATEIDVWQLNGAGGGTNLGSGNGIDLDVIAVRPTGTGTSRILLSSEIVGSAPGTLALQGFTGQAVFSQGGSPPRASAVVGRLDGPDGRPTVIVQGGSETIAAFQPLTNGQVNTLWTRQGLGGRTGATQFTGQHDYSGVALADVNGDADLETIYATVGDSGQARLVAAAPDGSEVWHTDFDVPGGTRIFNQPGLTLWRTGHFTSTEYEDVLVQIMRGSGGTGEFHLLDGRTGVERWMRTYGNTPGSNPLLVNAGEAQMVVYDWDGDGLDEAVNFHPYQYYVVDGNGMNLIDKSIYNGGVFPGGSPLYGTPVVADFLDNGTPTILFAGSYAQFGLITTAGTPVWYKPFVFDAYPGFIEGVGDVDNDGDLDILAPGFRVSPANETVSKFNAYDAATGNLLWTVDLPGHPYAAVGGAFTDSPTLSVSGDVDNDGRVESVFAINSTIYVVGANPNGTSGQIEWTFTVPGFGLLSSPIIADANGDGRPEIIVTSTTGWVYAIAPPPVPGDVNGDAVVNIFDVNLVSSHWGNIGQAGIPGDANNDGTINIFDINLISSNWTPSGGGGAGDATSADGLSPPQLPESNDGVESASTVLRLASQITDGTANESGSTAGIRTQLRTGVLPDRAERPSPTPPHSISDSIAPSLEQTLNTLFRNRGGRRSGTAVRAEFLLRGVDAIFASFGTDDDFGGDGLHSSRRV